MKHACLFLTIILLAGCQKEGSDVKYRTVYTSSSRSPGLKKSSMSKKAPEAFYIQYRDFVRTISPDKVTAKLNTIRFLDRKNTDPGMQTMIEIIGVNWPSDDERRFADFKNGNAIEVVPEMFGNVDNDGWFVDENIKLKYLFILPQEFIFEYDMSDQFEDVQFHLPGVFNEKQGSLMKCSMDALLYQVDDYGLDAQNAKVLRGFIFGETDSTYLVNPENMSPQDVTELITQSFPQYSLRSGNYVSPVLTPPIPGEPKVITTTISFDTENIIQHYAGVDNIPYTFDDVFVLEPAFWERFSVKIDQN